MRPLSLAYSSALMIQQAIPYSTCLRISSCLSGLMAIVSRISKEFSSRPRSLAQSGTSCNNCKIIVIRVCVLRIKRTRQMMLIDLYSSSDRFIYESQLTIPWQMIEYRLYFKKKKACHTTSRRTIPWKVNNWMLCFREKG